MSPAYTVAEVAALESICVETVRRLIARGALKAYGAGRLTRVTPESLEEYRCRSRVAVPISVAPTSYQRAGIWYAWLPGDPPLDRSLRTRDRADAARLFAELLAGRRPDGAVAGPADEALLVAIGEAYLTAPHGWKPRTAVTRDHRVAAFLRWCEGRGLTLASQLTAGEVEAWRTHMLATHEHATVNRHIVVVRKMMRYGAEQQLCGECPFVRMKVLKEDRRLASPIIPSPAEAVAVATQRGDAGDDLGRMFILLGLATGMRISELRTVPPDNIFPGAIHVPPGKGRVERSIPITPNIGRLAREYVGMRDAPYHDPRGRLLKNHVPVSDHWAAEMLSEGCAAAGVERFTPHDLRRVFATECFRGDIPLTVVQRWMGHKDVETTKRYLGRYRADDALVVPVPAALQAATKGRP